MSGNILAVVLVGILVGGSVASMALGTQDAPTAPAPPAPTEKPDRTPDPSKPTVPPEGGFSPEECVYLHGLGKGAKRERIDCDTFERLLNPPRIELLSGQ